MITEPSTSEISKIKYNYAKYINTFKNKNNSPEFHRIIIEQIFPDK